MKVFTFDIMLNGRFICTLKYKYCALFPIDFEDLKSFILSKRPTLKGKDYRKDSATYKKVSDKPEHEFQPFEKVLVRDDYGGIWEPDFFSRKAGNDVELKYMCLTTVWKFCIPYEGNEHLLGTKNDPED